MIEEEVTEDNDKDVVLLKKLLVTFPEIHDDIPGTIVVVKLLEKTVVTVLPPVEETDVGRLSVPPTVLVLPGWERVEAVVCDVGGCVATLGVCVGTDVSVVFVVLPAVVLEVLAVLEGEVGTVGVYVVVVVVPSD